MARCNCCGCETPKCPPIYGTVGFEKLESDIASNVNFTHKIENLKDDWGQLDFCDYLVMGHGNCSYSFSASTLLNFSTIRIWLSGDKKRRLLFLAEYRGCETDETHLKTNNFLNGIGSGIRLINDPIYPDKTPIIDCGIDCKWVGKKLGGFLKTEKPADPRKFHHACVSPLSGGIPMVYADEDDTVCFVALDQIDGGGFILVSRDCNPYSGGSTYNNCKIWDDFFTLPAEKLA